MTDRLELWYRRLIALYPTDHRAVYAEEMVHVLMESALPGQQRPRLSTGFDLMKGAAASWTRRGVAAGRAWRQAEATAAVILLALLALCTLSLTALGQVLTEPVNSSHGHWGELAMWSSDLIWLPVTVAAVLGRQRTAARLAWSAGLLLPAAGSLLMSGGWTPGYLGGLQSVPWVAVALIAAIGLSSDRPLRSGFPVLRHSGSNPAALGVAAIAVTVLVLIGGFYAWTDGGSWYSDLSEQLDLLLPLTLLAGTLAVARRPPVASPITDRA